MATRKTMINTALIIFGILGYGVLCLPWYELSSSATVVGYSSTMSFGSQLGFTIGSLTYFGYGLLVLPGAAIALAIKNDDATLSPKIKGLALQLIGLGELFCLFMVQRECDGYGTSMYGDGFSSSAGFYEDIGFKVAWALYIVTSVVGFILFIIAPKAEKEPVVEDDNPIADDRF